MVGRRRTNPRKNRNKRLPTFGLGMPVGGVLFCLGTLVIGAAAIDSDNNLLLILFGLCLGALVLNMIASWRTLRGLTVKRITPDITVAGQPMELRYVLTNHRMWTSARSILLREILDHESSPLAAPAEAFVAYLRPGESVSVTVPALCVNRGRVRLAAVELSTGFPFGILTKRIRHRTADEVVVFPCLRRLKGRLIERTRRTEGSSSGTTIARTRGDDEYYGIREYRQGDNPRRIHWRRSAQMGQLVIREMAEARDPQLWCVLETRIDPRDIEQMERLEDAFSAAATIICDALEKGTRVGLICSGEPLLVLPPGAGKPRRTRLLRELAVRTTNSAHPLSEQLQRVGWPSRWRGTCILLAAAETADLRDAGRLLTKSLGPTRICIPGTSAFENLFDEPAWSSIAAPPVEAVA